MEQPTPRVALGLALRGIATAAVDVSDGLLGDLGHVLRQSRVGATISAPSALTLLGVRLQAKSPSDLPDEATQLEFVLAGGDDYELVFTAPQAQREAVAAAAQRCATRVTRIGRIDAEPGVRVLDGGGQEVRGRYASFDHFA
jgi:thiamine-monophosphate kinase